MSVTEAITSKVMEISRTFTLRIAKTFDDERNCNIHLAYIKLCRMYNASLVKSPRQKFQERRILEAAQNLLNLQMKSPEEDHWTSKIRNCTKERAQLINNMNDLILNITLKITYD